MADTTETTEVEEKPVEETQTEENKGEEEAEPEEEETTPVDEKEEEPPTEESPEALKERIEKLETRLEEAEREPEDDGPDERLEEINAEISTLDAEFDGKGADEFDEDFEARAKLSRRQDITKQINDLREERRDLKETAKDAESEKARALEAHERSIKTWMKDTKLPPSSFNALDKRVRERFRKQRPDTREHYEAVVEAEALRLKSEKITKAKTASGPKPSVGTGAQAEVLGEQLKPGSLDDVAKQMKALGM